MRGLLEESRDSPTDIHTTYRWVVTKHQTYVSILIKTVCGMNTVHIEN